MIMKNEIIQEAWKTKDSIAAEHHHDMKRLVKSLRVKQKTSGVRVVDLHARSHTDRQTR